MNKSSILALFLLIEVLALTFPDVSVKCPTVQSIAGHSAEIKGITYVPGTSFYVSVDSANIFQVNDIRSGEVYFQTALTSLLSLVGYYGNGVNSLQALSNGDVLIVCWSAIYTYNIFTQQTYYFAVSTANQHFELSDVMEIYNPSTKTYTPQFLFVMIDLLSNLTIIYTVNQLGVIQVLQTMVLAGSSFEGKTQIMPSQHMFAFNVQGVGSSSNPLNFLIGFSTESDIFVCSFPDTASDSFLESIPWSSIRLKYQVISFVHLKGTSIISIQNGSQLQESLESTSYTLDFYDLRQLTPDSTSGGIVFNASNMIESSSLQRTQLTEQTAISQMKVIQFQDTDHIAFVSITNQIFIYQLSGLIQNQYGIPHPTYVSYSTAQAIRVLISIPISPVPRIIVGYSRGTVISLDFSSFISLFPPNNTGSQHITSPSISFIQNSLTIQLASMIFDRPTNTIQMLGNLSWGKQITTIDYTEFNLVTSETSSTSISFSIPGCQSGTFIVTSSGTIFGIVQKSNQQYVALQSGVCPEDSSSLTSETVQQFSIFIRSSQGDILSQSLDLSPLNQAVLGINAVNRFTLSSKVYIALIFITSYFPFSNYCLLNQNQLIVPPTQITASQIYTQVYIYDTEGNLVASTTTSFCQIDEQYKTFINTVFDEKSQTLLLVFQKFLKVIYLSVDSGQSMNLTYQHVSADELLSVIQAFHPEIKSFELFISGYFLQNASLMIIQFTSSVSALIYTGIFSFSSTWASNSNLNLQLLSLVSASQITDENPYNISSLHYLSAQNVVIFQIQQYFKVYSISPEKQLTLNSVIFNPFFADSGLSYFIEAPISQDTSTFFILSASFGLKRIDLNGCLINRCFNSPCEFTTTIAQSDSSTLKDIFASSSSSVVHFRTEELDVAKLKLGKLISTMEFTTINYIINLDINNKNQLNLLNRYVQLDAYYANLQSTFFANSKINLQIKSINLSSSSVSLQNSKASVFRDSSLSLLYYQYICLSNIIWNTDLSNIFGSNNGLFVIQNDYFILDQVQVVLTNHSLNSAYRYFITHSGKEAYVNNLEITNQIFSQSNTLFYIDCDYSISFNNLHIKNNTFIDSFFIGTDEELILNINNSLIENNTISASQLITVFSNYFITSQTISTNSLTFSNNIFKDTIIFGKGSHGNSIGYAFDSTHFISNKFLTQFSTSTSLLVEGKLSQQQLATSSTFSYSNSQIISNSQLSCLDSTCLSSSESSQSNNSSPSQMTIGTDQQQYNLIFLQYISSAVLNNLTTIDNIPTFINYQRALLFQIDNFKCSNSLQSTSQGDQSCISMSGFNKLNFTMTNSTFFNKFILNTFVISAFSDSRHLSKTEYSDGSFSISNTTFDSITLKTENSFYRQSSVYLDSLQILTISFESVKFNNIISKTPEKIFFTSALCLLISAPFSTLTVEKSEFNNLSTTSSATATYFNALLIVLSSSKYYNNNGMTYNSDNFNGGFVDIQSNCFICNNTSFKNSMANQGSAVSLTPSQANAFFNFTNCIFEDLIAQTNGGAVLIAGSLNSTILTFTKCVFNNIAATYGGVVYSQFSLMSQYLSYYMPVFPLINFDSCNATNLFAVQGGLAYVLNSNVTINKFQSIRNNPIMKDYLSSNLITFLSILPIVGEYLSLTQSCFYAEGLSITGHIIDKTKPTSSLNIAFLKSTAGITRIIQSSFANNEFSDGGFLLSSSSKIIIISSNFTKFNYVGYSEKRILATEIATVVNSKFSALIIQSASVFQLSNLVASNINCGSSMCFGGALVIFQSNGIIENSTFQNNQCASNGGAIGIANLSGDSQIINTNITMNSALQGYGGGIGFMTDLTTHTLYIKSSQIIQNQAICGGGMYFEIQNGGATSSGIQCQLLNTKIQLNTASNIGGGIFYQGYAPKIEADTIIDNNNSGSPFGQNQFSYPKKLQINEKLSKREKQFQYQTHSNPQGEIVILLKDQVSGTAIPNLIFNLLDEKENIIDNSYMGYTTQVIALNIVSLNFQQNYELSSSVSEFQFSEYFNITGFTITCTPGTTVEFALSSYAIQQYEGFSSYRLLLQVELRQCHRGEVFKKVISKSGTFYQCSECPNGEYSLEFPDLQKPVEACTKCSTFASCPGRDIIVVNPGYWRIDDQTSNIIECYNAHQNCLGGPTNNTCAVGHMGPLCESCDIENDFTIAGNFQCGSCGNQIVNAFKIAGIFFFYILSAQISVDGILDKLLTLYQKKGNLSKKELEKVEQNTSILLKLLLNYFQIIMVLTTFKISIPSIFNSTFDVVSSPTTQILYSFECFFYQIQLTTGINRIYMQLISSIILPIVCILIFFISGVIRYRKDSYRKSFYINTSFLYSLMYFQPSIFKNAISLVSCRLIDLKNYIRFNVAFECYTDEYWKWSLSLVLPVIIVVAIIIPLLLGIKLYQTKDNLILRKKYFFMTGEYKPNIWFWEFIKMYLKLLIMCCLTFYEYDIPNKILFIFFLVVLYGFLLFQIKPYRLLIYNRIDIFQTVVQAISIYLGFVAYQNQNELFWFIGSITFIAVINLAFVIWSVKLLASAYIFQITPDLEDIKIQLVRINCCRKYFFSKKSGLYYLRKRWMKSIIDKLKGKNMVNVWTGKLKVDKTQLFHFLQMNSQRLEEIKIGKKSTVIVQGNQEKLEQQESNSQNENDGISEQQDIKQSQSAILPIKLTNSEISQQDTLSVLSENQQLKQQFQNQVLIELMHTMNQNNNLGVGTALKESQDFSQQEFESNSPAASRLPGSKIIMKHFNLKGPSRNKKEFAKDEQQQNQDKISEYQSIDSKFSEEEQQPKLEKTNSKKSQQKKSPSDNEEDKKQLIQFQEQEQLEHCIAVEAASKSHSKNNSLIHSELSKLYQYDESVFSEKSNVNSVAFIKEDAGSPILLFKGLPSSNTKQQLIFGKNN